MTNYKNREEFFTLNEEHIHEYSDWDILKPATEIEDGIKSRTCKECNYVEKAYFDINNNRVVYDGNYQYLYDENGNKIKIIKYYKYKGIMKRKYEIDCKYDGNRNMIRATYTIYDSKGNVKGQTIKFYDPKGNNIKSKYYDAKGRLTFIEVSKYDEDDNMTESTTTYYDSEGNVKNIMVTEYDDKETNNKVIFKYYDAEGNITDKKLYEYDKTVNQIKKTIIEYDENTNEIKSTSIEYDVDESNMIDTIVDEFN